MPFVRYWLRRYRDHVLRTVETRKASYVAALEQLQLDGPAAAAEDAAALAALRPALATASPPLDTGSGQEQQQQQQQQQAGPDAASAAGAATVVVRPEGWAAADQAHPLLQAVSIAPKPCGRRSSSGGGGGSPRSLQHFPSLSSADTAEATEAVASPRSGSLGVLARQAPALLVQVQQLLARPEASDGAAAALQQEQEEQRRRGAEEWQDCAAELGTGGHEAVALALPPPAF